MSERVRRGLALLVVLAMLPTPLAGCASALLVPMATISGTAMAGGLLYRQRGGALELGIGTQGARLVWAVPTGVLVAGLAGAWWLVPIVTGTAFASQMLAHAAHQRSGVGLERERADREIWRGGRRVRRAGGRQNVAD